MQQDWVAFIPQVREHDAHSGGSPPPPGPEAESEESAALEEGHAASGQPARLQASFLPVLRPPEVDRKIKTHSQASITLASLDRQANW